MTERVATAAARHPGLTIWAWIAAVVLSIVFVVFFLGDALSGEAEQLNNPESEQAYALIGERLPPDPNFTTDVVLIRSDSVATDSPGFGRERSGGPRAARGRELRPLPDRRVVGRARLSDALGGGPAEGRAPVRSPGGADRPDPRLRGRRCRPRPAGPRHRRHPHRAGTR